MKKIPTVFLQIVTVLIGLAVFTFLIRFPLTEGRAVNLDLFSIYADPFIIYGYIASVFCFVALYQIFKLLGYVRQNKIFSPSAVKALRTIKYCAIILSTAIVAAVLFIVTSHNVDDDPAGFVAMGIVTTFISIVVAAAAKVFEGILESKI